MPENTSDTVDPANAPAAPAAPKPAELPPELQACVEKIRNTIGSALSEEELIAVLKKNLRPLRDWPRWSEPAREAYAHLLAAQAIHDKALSLCITHGLALEDAELNRYQQSLQSLQTVRRG